MSTERRMSDLEKKTRTVTRPVPARERIQVLRPGESLEERIRAVIARYGRTTGVRFLRIKGRTA